MVGQMKDSFETDVFGQDAYPSLEEKAANLLYFNNKRSSYLGVLNNSTNAGALIAQVSAVLFCF